MDNKDKNDEGTSVDQPESEARAVEDDFEILDIREANELEKPGETNTRDIAGETVKEEITEEPDKQDAHVAGETALNEVAGETVQQKVVMETDKQEVTDEKDKQEVAGETGKGEIAGEAKRQKPDEATGGQDMDMDDEMVIDRKEDARDHGAESKERVWQDNWVRSDFFFKTTPVGTFPCQHYILLLVLLDHGIYSESSELIIRLDSFSKQFCTILVFFDL